MSHRPYSSRQSSPSSEVPALRSSPSQSAAESETSVSDSPVEHDGGSPEMASTSNMTARFPQLFNENIFAKPIKVASRGLQTTHYSDHTAQTPWGYPEIVPQTGRKQGQYDLREPEFWTCGFFPGTLLALLERATKFPHASLPETKTKLSEVHALLRPLCQAWTEPLHPMAARTDTHDIGFIIMPALQRDWELNGNQRSLDSIIRAAYSLGTRYCSIAGAIRSWDILIKKEIVVTDMDENLLVIIDSLCNLDLLFYASAHNGDPRLAYMATSHARTLLDTHLRPEGPVSFPNQGYHGQLYSTCHVANIDPQNGSLKWRWTAQGYSNESTWARGQSWAILGYAQTYTWTKDPIFLEASCGAAEYFLYKLESAPSCVEVCVDSAKGDTKRTTGRYVPLWDFDAPVDPENPLRDSSAGMIAANGMLILSQALRGTGQHKLSQHFLETALGIVRDTTELCMPEESMEFESSRGELGVRDTIPGRTFEGMLKNGTANNNENARRRYADHGLVYGDYYLVEFGNRLLNMGLA